MKMDLITGTDSLAIIALVFLGLTVATTIGLFAFVLTRKPNKQA